MMDGAGHSSHAPQHVPVLVEEVLDGLGLQPGQFACDGTLGGGGHTQRLLEYVGATGRVLALDRDPQAVQTAAVRFAGAANLELVCASYHELPDVLSQRHIERVDAVLLDLGLSSDQLADPERGFSFDAPGQLDLRFNPEEGEPAWRLLERLPERQLADLIYQLGEERYSRRIARRVVESRRAGTLRNTSEFARLVRACVPRSPGLKIDPATRTFQALRIAVNRELEILELAIERFPDILRPGGRVAVISFHSLEDRIVKHAFREDPRYTILTKKPIRPKETEIRQNPRSRSARLRVAERSRVPDAERATQPHGKRR